jgi:hypothetical protein
VHRCFERAHKIRPRLHSKEPTRHHTLGAARPAPVILFWQSFVTMESFVSLRNYLEQAGGARHSSSNNNTDQHDTYGVGNNVEDARTLSTTTDDELTAGYSTNVCPEEFCLGIYDAITDFDHVKPIYDDKTTTTASDGSPLTAAKYNIEDGYHLKSRQSAPVLDLGGPMMPPVGDSTFLPQVDHAKHPTKPLPLEQKTHFRIWGHGRLWTLLALTCAYISCGCAVWCRFSTNFVGLKQPMMLGSGLYRPVESVGLIRMEVCYNETAVVTSTTKRSGCEIIRLSPDDVQDPMFNISRSLLTMATLLGIVLTVIVTTSIVWESVNLRPVGFGFLLTYFFQSFSLLFFDTNLCHRYGCTMATGGILCIITSVFWVATIVAVAKMDSYKIRAIRTRRRDARRKERRERRERQRLQELDAQIGKCSSTRSKSRSPTGSGSAGAGSPTNGSTS